LSEQTRQPLGYLRAIALSVLTTLLLWQVITRSFVAYLATIAPETALSLAPTNPDVLLNLADKQLLERLEAALKDLGDRCRELFRLKLQGFTFPEIQKRLGVSSLNTLYTWDFRCRKQLIEKLGEDLEK